jgi:hypothetical protein
MNEHDITIYTDEINRFKIKYGIDAPGEKILSVLHLMNTFGLDHAVAIAQTTMRGDQGMDSWHYVEDAQRLNIYRSRLLHRAGQAGQGLVGLTPTIDWLEELLRSNDTTNHVADDPCFHNLHKLLHLVKKTVKEIHFKLISPFNSKDIENHSHAEEFVNYLKKSRLNKTTKIKLSHDFEKYNLGNVIPKPKEYSLERSEISKISMNSETHLEITFVPLASLVDLYRQRGDLLFDKNVRLSLKSYKKAKDKLVTPMEGTLKHICDGHLPAELFTFYHGGVTIAVDSLHGKGTTSRLESPSIINGCQTVTIANQFLTKLENAQETDYIERFKRIRVIAKIVVAAPEDDLREITNANNRHNAIDNWQLYSNSPIHVAIELALKKKGVFYERQEGKYDAVKDEPSFVKEYHNTNKTYISVQYLGQIIALCKRHLNFAAKKAEIFTKTDNHDLVYDKTIPDKVDDIIFMFNLLKALERAMVNYLDKPAYADGINRIFERPMIQAHINYLGCLYYYQKENKNQWRYGYYEMLNKKASSKLVDDIETTYLRQIMSKIKKWYIDEHGMPDTETRKLKEPNLTKLKQYMDQLAAELDVDINGNVPFVRSIDWTQYDGAIEATDEGSIKI